MPALELTIDGEPGSMMLGGVAAELREFRTAMSYQPEQKKIEILPSLLRIGDTRVPFNGGLIDIDNVPDTTEVNRSYPGIAFDMVIADGVAVSVVPRGSTVATAAAADVHETEIKPPRK